MKTLFSADPFTQMPELGAGLGQQAGCVLIGTETHPSDYETLFQRSIEKYEKLGWTIVRRRTGRIFYDGTADMTPEANIWACPPGSGQEAQMGRSSFLREVRLAGGPALGQVGVVGGFGGPGGGFGFSGGPGGLVGPVAGAPGPGGGAPISGPSIPCGPAGYGPNCAWPNQPKTVVQRVYPVNNLMGGARV